MPPSINWKREDVGVFVDVPEPFPLSFFLNFIFSVFHLFHPVDAFSTQCPFVPNPTPRAPRWVGGYLTLGALLSWQQPMPALHAINPPEADIPLSFTTPPLFAIIRRHFSFRSSAGSGRSNSTPFVFLIFSAYTHRLLLTILYSVAFFFFTFLWSLPQPTSLGDTPTVSPLRVICQHTQMNTS